MKKLLLLGGSHAEIPLIKAAKEMGYYVKSVVPVIESNYDKFTTVEKTIADFFIQNKEKSDFSVKAVSERLFVSKASLVRFAQKCGYHGYKEFIYQYEDSLIEKQESITGNTRMVLNAYQELLNKTYSLVDETQVGRIIIYLKMKIVGSHSVQKIKRVQLWRH